MLEKEKIMINVNLNKKEQNIDVVLKKHKQLQTKKIQIETEINNLEKQRNEIIEQAKSEYGVETLEELRNLYKKLSEENEKNIKQFEEEINYIEQQVNKLET
jgi:F0F1-type ATP synthase membrane subunit b/b'